MRDMLTMYDNFSYLDKLLGTSFFSKKSSHFKVGPTIKIYLYMLLMIFIYYLDFAGSGSRASEDNGHGTQRKAFLF